jgi:hypothetical protein
LSKPALSITKQALLGLAALAVLLWIVLFVPAWTLNYWQAWTFWLVFVVSITAISAYFLKKDLNLISSRLKVGPSAEKEGNQKSLRQLSAFSSFCCCWFRRLTIILAGPTFQPA